MSDHMIDAVSQALTYLKNDFVIMEQNLRSGISYGYTREGEVVSFEIEECADAPGYSKGAWIPVDVLSLALSGDALEVAYLNDLIRRGERDRQSRT